MLFDLTGEPLTVLKRIAAVLDLSLGDALKQALADEQALLLVPKGQSFKKK
jgi:hypothetical protein